MATTASSYASEVGDGTIITEKDKQTQTSLHPRLTTVLIVNMDMGVTLLEQEL